MWYNYGWSTISRLVSGLAAPSLSQGLCQTLHDGLEEQVHALKKVQCGCSAHLEGAMTHLGTILGVLAAGCNAPDDAASLTDFVVSQLRKFDDEVEKVAQARQMGPNDS
jgi:hypothetical protein